MEYDVIIIGAGPAGVSAGLYTKRANKKTLIIYNNESSLEKATKIENYYGFENGISGEELYKKGIEQAKNLGINVKKEEVIKIDKIKDIFEVKTVNENYTAKNVVLATGNKKNKPDIKNIEKFDGKGVSYCAICDGFFYRGKDVVVIGNGNYAIAETNDLINIVNHVTILTNGKKIPEFRAENVDIENRKAVAIEGNDNVEAVELDDGTKLKTDGVFVAQGVAGSTDFARKIGALVKNEKIVVNEKMQTTVEGLYACGDCIGGTLQVAKAVNDGMIAGIDIIKNM
ncbi:MAG: NAD(P)/FAD-dependent oxidoreductase [Clostridiales bacterium]|nr:NAD(P)/FAD-dependent oxidoreductase [Clostridiales bacterium]